MSGRTSAAAVDWPYRHRSVAEMDARPERFIGMTFHEIVLAMGTTRNVAASRLASWGLRVCRDDGRYYPGKSVREVEDAIRERVAAAAPTAPCFLCGCRQCCCRKAVVA